MAAISKAPAAETFGEKVARTGREIVKKRWLFFLLIPGILFFAIFKYIPIFGLKIAFQDYNQYDPSKSTWVGFQQFVDLFSKQSFVPVLRNTIVISLLKLILGFPIPVILALMMNEMRSLKFKKVSQTLLYLPHFISWVILSGIIMTLLDPDNGMITNFLQMITGQRIMVLTDSRYFVPMLIITDIYKGLGWGTIIYFAAISGIDPVLYEAASIDGSGEYSTLLRIVVPISKPGIATVGLLTALAYWNEWFIPKLYVGSDPKHIPLQYLLMETQEKIDFLVKNSSMIGAEAASIAKSLPQDSLRMALVVLIVVPIAFAYPFFQRYIIAGLTIGSVKG